MIGLSEMLGWELLLGIAAVAGAIALASVAAAHGRLPHPASDPERGSVAGAYEGLREDPFEEPSIYAVAACSWFGGLESWMAIAGSPNSAGVPFGLDTVIAPRVAAKGGVAREPVGALLRQLSDGRWAGEQAGEPGATRRLVDEDGRREGHRVVPPHAAGPAP